MQKQILQAQARTLCPVLTQQLDQRALSSAMLGFLRSKGLGRGQGILDADGVELLMVQERSSRSLVKQGFVLALLQGNWQPLYK